jgi:thiamine biosynthesis lipoprotein
MAGCAPKVEERLFMGDTMGTTYSVKVLVDPDESGAADALGPKLQERLDDIEGKMSTYQDDSELSLFNASRSTEPVTVSEETAEVFAIALEVSEQTGGTFDITVGPLVDAWGFGPEAVQETPSDAEIAELRERVGYRMLTVDRQNNTVRKSRPDVQCDLSAIAKGYAVDKLAEDLEAAGFVDYMAEVGGEVRAGGVNRQGVPWRIAIEKPVPGERRIESVVPLSGYAMAGSGDYRNFREVDGESFSHTIDPRTGRPVRHKLAAVSVIHEECAYADAYATGLMVLPPGEAMALAEELGLVAVMQVHLEGDTFGRTTTRNFEDFVVQMRAAEEG